MNENFKTAQQISARILDRYNKPEVSTGKPVGFECLLPLMNFLKKHTSYFTGSPGSGKTEFVLEIVINLATFYGWRIAVFTPETGEDVDIFIELIRKYVKKPFDKRIHGHMTENEMYGAIAWLTEHFYLIDPKDEKDLTVEGMLRTADRIEEVNNIKLDVLVIDPWNELAHNFINHSGREDKYLEFTLGLIRRNAREKNRHNIILAHPRTMEPNKEGFYDPATYYQLSGGAAWAAKGEQMVCVWRPPAGVINKETGTPYEPNETHIIVQKSKPKGVGAKGKAILYLDPFSHRYYEKHNFINKYARKLDSSNYTPKIVENEPF